MPQHSSTPKPPDNHSMTDRFGGPTGLAANIITIVLGGISLVQAISSSPVWILLGIAALLGLVAYWAHRRRWTIAAVGLLMLVVFGAGGWLVAYHDHAASSAGSGPSAPPRTNASPTASSSPTASHKTIFDDDISLDPDQAVDVDTPHATVASNQRAATNGNDIYYQAEHEVSSADLSAARSMSSVSVGLSPAAAYTTCRSHTASQSYAITSVGIYPGSSAFCFVTSDRHLGWAAVKGFDDTTKTATLAVIVWDTTITN